MGFLQENSEADQVQYLACCSKIHELQEAIDSARQKHAEALSLANSKLPDFSKFDLGKNSMRSDMRVLKQKAARLTDTRNALELECSRLAHLLGAGSVYVSPVSIVSPLQSEDSYFAITECPVCSLGFFCKYWVPTPCGHCYHPSCLFPLLQFDSNIVPKCLDCSEVFHPSWLECWGSPLVKQ